jgi:predicted permease
MLLITITAAIDQNIFEAAGSMWPNWWFKATLADAYFGFLTFFVWVAYKEIHLWRKLAWFTSLMLLGNFAISAYMLIELNKLQVGDTFETMLTRRSG